ncbi:MAG: hypothetical protein RL329_507 [Bacteroidota bacterium]|jgi:hypothetical protein
MTLQKKTMTGHKQRIDSQIDLLVNDLLNR